MNQDNNEIELISELVEATLNEDGYQTMRFEEAGQSVTAYRGIFIKGRDGKVYEIILNRAHDTEGVAFPKREGYIE